MQKIAHPEQIWKHIMEAFVLAFHHDGNKRIVTFVCGYPKVAQGAHRAFVGVVYSGVTEFHRQLGGLAKHHRFRDDYQLEPDMGPIVIQHVEATPHPSGTVQEFWFGPSFGGITFTFDSVEGFIRNALVTEINGEYIYHDADTGERYDFYVPFPALQFPTSNADE